MNSLPVREEGELAPDSVIRKFRITAADLFEAAIPNVSIHPRNIFARGMLTPEATVKNFLTVRKEGSRQISLRANALKGAREPLSSEEHTRLGCGFRRLAGKSGRRAANPDTRDACAPQQKKLAARILCHFERLTFQAFALVPHTRSRTR